MSTPPPPATQGSILLVEDDAVLASVIQLALEHVGFDCQHATDGKTARALFDAKRCNLLVADVNIPDGDGIALVASLQAARRVPVVVMTGNPTVEAALAALHVPLVAFLTKPFPIDALLAAVHRGIATERVLSDVSGGLRRIESWRGELVAFEAMLQQPQQPPQLAATLLALNARHVMEAMAELRVQIAALTAAPEAEAHRGAVNALNATRPVQLVEAIRDTIAVLDRTKDAFRSRELGELRKRLAALIAAGGRQIY